MALQRGHQDLDRRWLTVGIPDVFDITTWILESDDVFVVANEFGVFEIHYSQLSTSSTNA
jgi:hypothetical protein